MNPKDKIHSSWNDIEQLLTKDSKLIELNTHLSNIVYYPEKQNIFNVFQMDIKDIKVILLGQDPYFNKNQAIGYSFAVSNNVIKPPSLKIIEKELRNVITDNTLKNWTDQGVFLLNTALTVEHKKPDSHTKYWENFTKKVIEKVSLENPCIWLLWGRKAQMYEKYIYNKKDNYILKASHPASETYSNNGGFLGCNHFNIVNDILEDRNLNKIVWV